ncbi:hypothetical protein GEV39_01500 [Pseudomonas sp. NY5710]|nr:hypothetical protein GEV39_01500 [Pseudomonas sp. NY5710]
MRRDGLRSRPGNLESCSKSRGCCAAHRDTRPLLQRAGWPVALRGRAGIIDRCRSGFTREYGGAGNAQCLTETGPQAWPFRG